jgi:hypothetical protein
MGDASNVNKWQVVQAVNGPLGTEWRVKADRFNRYREVSLSVGRTF